MSPGLVRRWPLALIAAPAAVAVWSGWVGLGTLCGFGIVHPLPGIADGFQLNTAITLPVGVEAYGAYALGAWLTPGTTPAARRFARRSALGALGLGMAGQVIYHLLAASHAAAAPWPVVMLVSCLPVLTLGLGVALTHLLRTGPGTASTDQAEEHLQSSRPANVAASAGTIGQPTPSARPRPAGRRRAPRKARRPVPDVDALMPLGWQVTADLAGSGVALTRDTLAAGLRSAGQTAGNARVGVLLARLKTEAPTDPADAPDRVPALADGGNQR
jgi:hypothetical protein